MTSTRACDDGAGGGAIPVAAALGARRPRAAVLRRRLRDLRPRQRRRHRAGAAGTAGVDPLLPGAQRAGDGAHRGRLREDAQPPAHARLHLVDRPRRDQHDHRRGRRDDQPRAGAAAAGRHLRRPRPRARPAAARIEPVAGRVGERLLQAGVALLGSDQPARTDHHVAARSDARADVAGRNRRGHPGAAAGRAGRSLRLPRGAVRAAGLDDRARPRRSRSAAGGGGADPREHAAADRRRRRRALQRGHRRAAALRRRDRDRGRRDAGGQGIAARSASAVARRRRRDRHARRPTSWRATPIS